MICQNCKKEVDNDLVFCTECGSRLHETISTNKTAVMPESVVTKFEEKKSNSSLKIATIVVGVIAIFSVLGVAALVIINPFSTKPVSQTPTPKNTKTSTPKTANQNKTVNLPANNSNAANNSANLSSNNSANENAEKEPPKLTAIIVNDRISIYADSSVAYSFTVKDDLAKIAGKVEIVQGEQFDGYVFSQQVYDENQVNPVMKIFSFESGETEQFLPKGDYVLVFANTDGKGVTLNAKFTQTTANPAK